MNEGMTYLNLALYIEPEKTIRKDARMDFADRTDRMGVEE